MSFAIDVSPLQHTASFRRSPSSGLPSPSELYSDLHTGLCNGTRPASIPHKATRCSTTAVVLELDDEPDPDQHSTIVRPAKRRKFSNEGSEKENDVSETKASQRPVTENSPYGSAIDILQSNGTSDDVDNRAKGRNRRMKSGGRLDVLSNNAGTLRKTGNRTLQIEEKHILSDATSLRELKAVGKGTKSVKKMTSNKEVIARRKNSKATSKGSNDVSTASGIEEGLNTGSIAVGTGSKARKKKGKNASDGQALQPDAVISPNPKPRFKRSTLDKVQTELAGANVTKPGTNPQDINGVARQFCAKKRTGAKSEFFIDIETQGSVDLGLAVRSEDNILVVSKEPSEDLVQMSIPNDAALRPEELVSANTAALAIEDTAESSLSLAEPSEARFGALLKGFGYEAQSLVVAEDLLPETAKLMPPLNRKQIEVGKPMSSQGLLLTFDSLFQRAAIRIWLLVLLERGRPRKSHGLLRS